MNEHESARLIDNHRFRDGQHADVGAVAVAG